MVVRWVVGLVVCVGCAVAAAPAVAIPPGGLTPLIDARGCLLENPVEAGFGACSPLPSPLASTQSVAVSPDNAFLYVAGRDGGGAIKVFRRDAGGRLTEVTGAGACVARVMGPGCTPIRGVTPGAQIYAIAVSADRLYAVSHQDGAVATFARNASNGTLTQLGGVEGCITDTAVPNCRQGRTLANAWQLAVSPNSQQVYVAGQEGLTVLQRTAPGGGLIQPADAEGCVDNDGAGGANSCADGRAMPGDDLNWVAVAPNGAAVYATTGNRFTWTGTSVLAFTRSSQGVLTVPTSAGDSCAQQAGNEGCLQVPAFTTVSVVAPSSDSEQLYVGAGNTIQVLTLHAEGTIDELDATGCVSDTAAFQCEAVGGLQGPIDLAVSRDGSQVYVAAIFSEAVRALNRDPATGALSGVPVQGCWSGGGTGLCPRGPAVGDVEGIGLSPDGKTLYTAATTAFIGRDGVAAYARDLTAPTCNDASATTAANTSITLTLPCSDLDGGPLTFAKVSSPAGAVLGDIDQATGRVGFGPLPGFSGTTSFQFRATSAGLATRTATFRVTVTPPPPPPSPPPPPPPPPPPTPRIDPDIINRWSTLVGVTTVRRLVVRRLPRNATVRVRCRGKGCPFKSKRFRPSRRRTVVLTKRFKGRRLRVGTTVQIRTTAPGAIGNQVTYKMRRSDLPSVQRRCLPVGSNRPRRSC